MKHVNNRKEIQNADTAYKTVSTLLIPDRYLNYFNEQCRIHKGRSNYFQYILNCFASQIKCYEKRMIKGKKNKWKTHYQDQGMGLSRRNFRPSSVHWEQCRHTAGSFGISMCYLFVFLMELEMLGICIQKKKKSGKTIKNMLEKTEKFFCCIRRVDFYPKSLKRELIYLC